jgi:hypothetical protein
MRQAYHKGQRCLSEAVEMLSGFVSCFLAGVTLIPVALRTKKILLPATTSSVPRNYDSTVHVRVWETPPWRYDAREPSVTSPGSRILTVCSFSSSSRKSHFLLVTAMMMTSKSFLLGFFALFQCIAARPDVRSIRSAHEFDRLLEKHAQETGLPVVVDFYSDSW